MNLSFGQIGAGRGTLVPVRSIFIIIYQCACVLLQYVSSFLVCVIFFLMKCYLIGYGYFYEPVTFVSLVYYFVTLSYNEKEREGIIKEFRTGILYIICEENLQSCSIFFVICPTSRYVIV